MKTWFTADKLIRVDVDDHGVVTIGDGLGFDAFPLGGHYDVEEIVALLRAAAAHAATLEVGAVEGEDR